MIDIDKIEKTIQLISYRDFDIKNVCIKAIEELSELIQALSKSMLKIKMADNLFEEIIDCEIMLNQLKYSFSKRDNINFDDIKQKKIIRVNNRLSSYCDELKFIN